MDFIKKIGNITGFSTGRYGTWYLLDQYNLLFDCGDGLVAHMGSKCEKIRHVFFSHADRDHLGGVIQFYQTAVRPPDLPKFYYPKDSGSFPALKAFLEKFDPQLPACEWVPVEEGVRIEIGKNQFVEVGENEHLAVSSPTKAGQVKSLDFTLIETRRKLRSEFSGLPGQQIAKLRAEMGEDKITEVVEDKVFGYSGDTPQFDVMRWKDTAVLVHEATFIAPDEASRRHCELGDVIRAAVQIKPEALVLGHFSSRYDKDTIINSIRVVASELKITFPIYAVLPTRVTRDVFASEPVWPMAK